MYKFCQKRDWKLCIYGSRNTHFFYEKKGCPLATTRNYILICTFRPKRAWNYAYLAYKIQNFLRQGGAAPPCNHIRIHFDRKGTKIVHLWFPRNTHSLMKRRAAPSQPPEIIYFCKLRPKRARNYAYLACKIPPPNTPGPPWTTRSSARYARFARSCLSPPCENLPKPMNYQKTFLFLFSWLNFASVRPIAPCHNVSIKRLPCHVFRCNDDIFRRGVLYFLWGIRLDIKKPIVYHEKTAI